MRKLVKRFINDEEGLTTVEYAAAGALLTGAAITAFTLLGTNVNAFITLIAGVIA